MNLRITIVAVLAVVFASAVPIVSAQTVPLPDPDWGENQNFQKAAEYWAWWEKSGPDTNISAARRVGAAQFSSMTRSMRMLTQAVTPAWKTVGGSLDGAVSGRPTSIAFSTIHSSTMYLGTSGGGLYKSTNYGSKWVPVGDNFTTNAVGGVAVDPNDDNIVYAGTGDLYNGNGEISKGDGMFKSVDGGINWTLIATEQQVGNAINQVLIDPITTSTVYTTASDGVHKSDDGGVTWKRVLAIGGTTHMVIDPNNSNRLFAAGAGVLKFSDDYGATWSGDLASNIKSKSTITLAISAKNSAIMYASIGSSATGNSVGLAKSLDSGMTWEIVSNPGGGYMSRQAFYDNACAVSPNSPNYVSVGGLDVYSFKDGGNTFSDRTDWTNQAGTRNYTHADVHVLTYGSGFLWALTDGGVFFSADNGASWQQRNSSLSTLLFTGGDADKDFTYAVGGAQDNGVSKTLIPGGTTFKQKVGGDGGRVYIDQVDGLVVYSTYINASLQKSPDAGETWNFGPGGTQNILPTATVNALNGEGVPFYMYYDVCESDPAVLAIAGGSNVYYSNDGAVTVNPITKTSPVKPGSPSTVYVPAANPSVVYCGASSTSYVTQDAQLGVWTKSTTTGVGTISDWASDPTDAGKVWVSVAGYGGHHFAVSTDYGATWQYPATNLPNLNYQAIARAPNGDLFLGHTLGVLRSLDNGVTWEALTDGMPLAQVNKLRVRGGATKYLLATTYGHGMYSIDITNLPRTINPLQGAVTSTTSAAGLWISSIAPNPSMRGGEFSIAFTTVTDGWASVKLYDESGRETKILANVYAEVGDNRIIATLPETSGTYFLVLSEGGQSVTRRIVVQ